MDLSLNDKIALVTGSSKGIGYVIANSLYEEGCTVILNGRHRNNLKLATKSLGDRSSYFVTDVTKPKECKFLIDYVLKKYGKIDILVCNVGSGRSVSVGKETLQDWKQMLEMNLFSATNVIKAAENFIKKSKGSIICISSIVGMESTGAPVTYSASKAALNSYVRGISRYFAKSGVRINAIAPGNILFKGSVWGEKLSLNKSRVKNMIKNNVSMNRFGTPEEIANLAIFLASSKASFITGTIFVVDGGQLKS